MKLLLLALAVEASARANQITSLDVVASCSDQIYSIDIANKTLKIKDPEALLDFRHNCPVAGALPFSGNRAMLLIDTLDDQSSDYRAPFELRLYSLPSWKLEGKRIIPGRQSDQSYIVPSRDGKSVVFLTLVNGEEIGRPKFAYVAASNMVPVPMNSVQALDYPASPQLDALLKTKYRPVLLPYILQTSKVEELNGIRSDRIPGATVFQVGNGLSSPSDWILLKAGKPTIFPSDKLHWYGEHLAETGDFVITRIQNPKPPLKPIPAHPPKSSSTPSRTSSQPQP